MRPLRQGCYVSRPARTPPRTLGVCLNPAMTLSPSDNTGRVHSYSPQSTAKCHAWFESNPEKNILTQLFLYYKIYVLHLSSGLNPHISHILFITVFILETNLNYSKSKES